MTLIQTELRSGTVLTYAWLPVDKRVHRGSIISLDGDNRKWEVMRQFSKQESEDIKRDWRVGGLP